MTTTAELFEHLRDAKPSTNMERKPVPQPRKPDYTGPLFKQEYPTRSRVEGPGFCIELLYDEEPFR